MVRPLHLGMLVCYCSLASAAVSLSKRSIDPHGVFPEDTLWAAKQYSKTRGFHGLGAKEPLDLELRLSLGAPSEPPENFNAYFGKTKSNEANPVGIHDPQTRNHQEFLQKSEVKIDTTPRSDFQTDCEPQGIRKSSSAVSKKVNFAEPENPLAGQPALYQSKHQSKMLQENSLKAALYQDSPFKRQNIGLKTYSGNTEASRRKSSQDREKLLLHSEGSYSVPTEQLANPEVLPAAHTSGNTQFFAPGTSDEPLFSNALVSYSKAHPETSTRTAFDNHIGLTEERSRVSNQNWFMDYDVYRRSAAGNHISAYLPPKFVVAPSEQRVSQVQPQFEESVQRNPKKQKVVAQLTTSQARSVYQNSNLGRAKDPQIGRAEKLQTGGAEAPKIGRPEKQQVDSTGGPQIGSEGKKISPSASFIARKIAAEMVKEIFAAKTWTGNHFFAFEKSKYVNLISVFSYSVLVRCIDVPQWDNVQRVFVRFLIRRLDALTGPGEEGAEEKQKLFLSSLKWISEFLCTACIPQFLQKISDYKENHEPVRRKGRPLCGWEISETTKLIYSLGIPPQKQERGKKAIRTGTTDWLQNAWESDNSRGLSRREKAPKYQPFYSLEQWSWEFWNKKAEEIEKEANIITSLELDSKCSSSGWVHQWNFLLSKTEIKHENVLRFQRMSSKIYHQLYYGGFVDQPHVLKTMLSFIPKENHLEFPNIEGKDLGFETMNFYFRRRMPLHRKIFWIDDVKNYFESDITTTTEFRDEFRKFLKFKKTGRKVPQ